jgi:tetratricopeptide (TPR) repeat protein
MAVLELGMVQQGLGVFDNALRTFQRAEDLDPRDPYVQRALTRIYIFAHRYDDALRAVGIREAGRTSGYVYDRAWIDLLRGEPEKAREVIDYYLGYSGGVFYNMAFALPLAVVGRCLTVEDRRAAIEDYLNWFGADAPCLTNTEWCVGRAIHAEAVGLGETAQSLWDSLSVGFEEQPPQSWVKHAEAARVYEALGEKALAIGEAEALVKLNGARSDGEVEDMFWFGPSGRIFLAQILAHFNEDDRAIDLLEELLPAPSWLTVHILEIDPIWDPLRSHPRFQALLEKYAEDVEH